MQDTQSQIQPITNEGPHAYKKASCWLYGLATIGGCSIVIFLISIVLLIQVWSTIRPFIQNDGSTSSSSVSFKIGGETINSESFQPVVVDGKIQITAEQKKLLDLAGIDSSKIEGQNLEVLRACAITQVGAERIAALESGEVSLGLTDLLAVKKCLE